MYRITNGVQTERQTDRVTYRGASLLQITTPQGSNSYKILYRQFKCDSDVANLTFDLEKNKDDHRP